VIAAGNWYTAASVFGYKSGDIGAKLYVNGLLEDESPTLSGDRRSTTREVAIGMASWLPRASALSDIECTLIYDRALSPQEIKLLHADPLAPFRKRSTVVTSFADPPAEPEPVAYPIIRKYSSLPTSTTTTAKIDWSNPLNQGLVRYYLGEKEARNDLTCLVTGTTATRQGGLSSFKNGPAGVQNAAEFASASEQHYQSPDSADLSFGNASTDSPFSISAWVYLLADPTGTVRPIASKSNNTGSLVEYYLSANIPGKGNEPAFVLYDTNGGQLLVDGGGTLDAFRWYHICGTYDGSGSESGLNLYRDSINISDNRELFAGYVAMHNTSSTFDIGCTLRSNATFEAYMQGQISDVRLYDRELSPGEVQGLYDLTRSGGNFATSRTVVTSFAEPAQDTEYRAYEIYYRQLLSNPGYSSF
jgi:hypothetical protein